MDAIWKRSAMSTLVLNPQPRKPQPLTTWLSRHWFGLFLIVYGIWVFLPFFAPVFMKIGWDGTGNALYFLYSFFCHQLPERSFFLFGRSSMYSLPEIQEVWRNTIDPFVLRRFIGNAAMGWKVAWSDRMISFYTSIWLFGLVWFPFRRKLAPISWRSFALLILPIAIDGGAHAISDLAGIGQGFRDTNQWLVSLTGNFFSPSFYAGDALGSFNSWMRLATGLLAGMGIAWLAFPTIEKSSLTNSTGN